MPLPLPKPLARSSLSSHSSPSNLFPLEPTFPTLNQYKNKDHDYCVEWDFKASTSNSNDDKIPSKSIAGITINEAPSLFNSTACTMDKGPKVKYDESDASASASASESDDDKEYSYYDLIELLEEAHYFMDKEGERS